MRFLLFLLDLPPHECYNVCRCSECAFFCIQLCIYRDIISGDSYRKKASFIHTNGCTWRLPWLTSVVFLLVIHPDQGGC